MSPVTQMPVAAKSRMPQNSPERWNKWDQNCCNLLPALQKWNQDADLFELRNEFYLQENLQKSRKAKQIWRTENKQKRNLPTMPSKDLHTLDFKWLQYIKWCKYAARTIECCNLWSRQVSRQHHHVESKHTCTAWIAGVVAWEGLAAWRDCSSVLDDMDINTPSWVLQGLTRLQHKKARLKRRCKQFRKDLKLVIFPKMKVWWNVIQWCLYQNHLVRF